MFAVLDDVIKRLGRPITDQAEIDQVNEWIEDAEDLILGRLRNLPGRVAAGLPTERTVVRVIANAVIRKIKNPDGKVSEGVDDYNYRLNENSRKGDIFLTDEEWADLTPGALSSGYSTRPRFEADSAWVHPDVWVPAP